MAMRHFGSGFLYGQRTDITGTTPQIFGSLQDVSVDFKGSLKKMFGTSRYPIAAARGQESIQCKAKMGELSANAFNTLFFGGAISTGQTAISITEALTIPAALSLNTSALTAAGSAVLTFASTTGVVAGAVVVGTNIPVGATVLSFTGTTVTLSANVLTGGVASGAAIQFGPFVSVANASTFVADEGLFYVSGVNAGLPLTKAATGGPVTGQYAVTNGVYSFAPGDGPNIYATYTYGITATGQKITLTNPQMGIQPVFGVTLATQYTPPGGGKRSALLNLHACIASGLNIATKIEDWLYPEFDFEALADNAGVVFDWSFSEVS